MSDDTPTQRYPVGGEPIPPATPGVPSDAPTETFVPPPGPPASGATGTDEVPPKKGKGLMITLICIGAALLLALIILLIILFTSGGGQPGPSASPSETSPSPTPSATSPSPTPSESEEPEVPGPAIASYTAAPTTVDCTSGTAQPVHFSWSTTGTTLWFGVGTDDASAEPFGTFPTKHEMDFNYQCGQTDSQQRYTITVQGENGDKKSQTIVIQETN